MFFETQCKVCHKHSKLHDKGYNTVDDLLDPPFYPGSEDEVDEPPLVETLRKCGFGGVRTVKKIREALQEEAGEEYTQDVQDYLERIRNEKKEEREGKERAKREKQQEKKREKELEDARKAQLHNAKMAALQDKNLKKDEEEVDNGWGVDQYVAMALSLKRNFVTL